MDCRYISGAVVNLLGLAAVFLAGNGRAGNVQPVNPASAGYTVTHWTVEDGLPIQNVTALAQTTNGFLWCGTFDGLARFDGLEFKVYFPHEVPELEGFQITGLLGDSFGRLWIVDARGNLTLFEHGVFRRIGEVEGIPANQAGEIRESPEGEIWIRGRSDGNFYSFRANHFQRIPASANSELKDFWIFNGAPAWGIGNGQSLVQLSPLGPKNLKIEAPDGTRERLGRFFDLNDGSLALTSAHGIYAWENQRWNLLHRFDAPIRGSPLDGCRDRKENYWIRSKGQGLILSLKGGQTVPVTLGDEFAGATIHALLQGREGNVWVGSSAGLHRISRNSIHHWTDSGGLPQSAVLSIANATNDGLCLIQDERINWLDPETKKLVRATGIAENYTAWRVASTADGTVLAAVSLPGENVCEIWRLTPQESKALGRVKGDSVQDLQGTTAREIFVATSRGLFQYQGEDFSRVELPFEGTERIVTALAEDHAGRVFAAVAGVGLFCRDNAKWRQLTQRSDQGSDRIQDLAIDSQGTLWVATDRPCLARLKDNKWFAYSDTGAAFPRKVRSLVADDQDGLWLTSRWGLVRASRRELNYQADQRDGEITTTWFGRDEGLVSTDCAASPSGICKDRRGRIWIATAQGIAMIDPVEWSFERRTRLPPPVYLEEVLIDDVPVPDFGLPRGSKQPSQLIVPPGSQRLEIHFTGVNLTAPEKLQFRYRLAGFDNTWANITGARLVHFGRLPPGDYNFQMMAANNEGVWNREGISLPVTVKPRFWQRTAVRVAATLGLLALLWAGSQHQIQRLKRQRAMQSEFSRQLIHSQEQERKRIAGELHDSLGQNLLVAKNLALTGVNANPNGSEAAKLFCEISQSVSTALSEARNLSKELRPPELDRMGVTKALRGMIQRAGEASHIECQLNIDDIDGLLPPEGAINLYRLMQEGMNNIVKHSRARHARITITHHPDHLALSIEDDGQGFDLERFRTTPSPHSGTGIAGMDERTHLANGVFEIFSRLGGGTLINIRIPVKKPQP